MISRIFRAAGASPGIAIGRLVFLGRAALIPSEGSSSNPEAEWSRFCSGVSKTESRLGQLQEGIPAAFSLSTAQLFESYRAIVGDPVIFDMVNRLVFDEKCNAEWAVYQAFARAKEVLAKVPNSHIAEKVDDLENVKEMLLEVLLDRESKPRRDLRGSIVVCESLTPREVLGLGQAEVAAIICETGTRSSHVAIVARNMAIPAVVGVGPFARSFKAGEVAAVDGNRGIVEVSPTPESLRLYELKSKMWHDYGLEMQERSSLPTTTRDGVFLSVLANVESSDEMPALQMAHADGIGLLRLEFFFMASQELPDEEEIFQELARMRAGLGNREMVIRLLDAGGDKDIPAITALLRSKRIFRKTNSAMGMRGVRLLLSNPGILTPQIKASLRANLGGKLKLLIPFVTSLDEIRSIKSAVRESWRELSLQSEKQIPFPEIGIMVETPAAAMMIDLFCDEIDFVSIGSNDLTQHALAVDRADGAVGAMYDWFHPSVLRMVAQVVSSAKSRNLPVSLCGEMASDFLLTELLLGMGLRTFSVNIHAIAGLREIIRQMQVGSAEQLVREVLGLRTSLEIRTRLQERFIDNFGVDLFALLGGDT